MTFPFDPCTIVRSTGVLSRLNWGFARFFNQIFPADCAVCQQPLQTISRIPACPDCLSAPQPLVAEFACRQCQTAFLNEFPLKPDGLCPLCRVSETHFDRIYSYGSYDRSLAKLLHLFKYAGVRTLATPLGNLMARGLPPMERLDVIVPVPLHWWKQLRRGFNQSELLASVVSQRLGIPLVSGLKRRRSTAVQAGLTNAMRRKNVAKAFQVSLHVFEGKRVLLIDDVMTTGSTVSAAAKALRQGGATRITVLTLARVDRRLPAMLTPNSSNPIEAATPGVF